MKLAESKIRELEQGPCFMCDGSPVVAISCYLPHQPPTRRKQRAMFYGLCCECMSDVADERTRLAALAAIERRVGAGASVPPWGRSQ